MKLDASSNKLFGTTRSSNVSSPGSMVHVFVVTLDSTTGMTPNGLETYRQIDFGIAGTGTYVTGIDNTLEYGRLIHMVYHIETAGSQSLYYVKFDTTGDSSSPAIKLFGHGEITNFYIRETVFAGTRSETIGTETGIK